MDHRHCHDLLIVICIDTFLCSLSRTPSHRPADMEGECLSVCLCLLLFLSVSVSLSPPLSLFLSLSLALNLPPPPHFLSLWWRVRGRGREHSEGGWRRTLRAILSSVRPSHLFPEAMCSTAIHKVLMTYISFRSGSSMLPGVRVIL